MRFFFCLFVALSSAIAACRSNRSPNGATTRASPPVVASAAVAPSNARTEPTPSKPPLEYVEIMTGGAGPNEREPLVVALHGLGDRPENFVRMFSGFATAARVVAPHSDTEYYDGYSWFPFRRGDPDFSAPGIGEASERVAAFARTVSKLRPTAGKPIVVGFSQGGALSFALAARHPETFAAAFPLSGWFPAALWPSAKPEAAPPIVAFHGTADTMVPIARMRPGAARLRELGFSIDVREFDGVGHAIPDAVRAALFDAMARACERERRAP